MRKARPPESIESEQFRSGLTELAHDFPMMDALLNAIRVRLSSDPDHGYQIQEDPDTFLHRTTGVGGAPTFRYMWRRSHESGRDRIRLIMLDRVLPGP